MDFERESDRITDDCGHEGYLSYDGFEKPIVSVHEIATCLGMAHYGRLVIWLNDWIWRIDPLQSDIGYLCFDLRLAGDTYTADELASRWPPNAVIKAGYGRKSSICVTTFKMDQTTGELYHPLRPSSEDTDEFCPGFMDGQLNADVDFNELRDDRKQPPMAEGLTGIPTVFVNDGHPIGTTTGSNGINHKGCWSWMTEDHNRVAGAVAAIAASGFVVVTFGGLSMWAIFTGEHSLSLAVIANHSSCRIYYNPETDATVADICNCSHVTFESIGIISFTKTFNALSPECLPHIHEIHIEGTPATEDFLHLLHVFTNIRTVTFEGHLTDIHLNPSLVEYRRGHIHSFSAVTQLKYIDMTDGFNLHELLGDPIVKLPNLDTITLVCCFVNETVVANVGKLIKNSLSFKKLICTGRNCLHFVHLMGYGFPSYSLNIRTKYNCN